MSLMTPRHRPGGFTYTTLGEFDYEKVVIQELLVVDGMVYTTMTWPTRFLPSASLLAHTYSTFKMLTIPTKYDLICSSPSHSSALSSPPLPS